MHHEVAAAGPERVRRLGDVDLAETFLTGRATVQVSDGGTPEPDDRVPRRESVRLMTIPAAKNRPSDALVVFGATGDLAHKMIFPALQALARDGRLTMPVVGVAKGGVDKAHLVARARDGIKKNGTLDAKAFARLAAKLAYVDGDYEDPDVFARLKKALGTSKRPLFYLAIPPSLFGTVAAGLAQAGLASGARIVVEKPFGHDLDSARKLDKTIHRYFPERAVFRIDHFLGKEPVENILYFRTANPWIRASWDRRSIESVQITMAENFGVKGRGAFYEGNGAIRDVFQNHLLEVIACIAMDTSALADPASRRAARSRLLECIRPLRPKDIVRGQFRGYRREHGVAPRSTVETFVSATLRVDNDRWRGVPFFVRSGKCLPVTVTEARIVGTPSKKRVFDEAPGGPGNDLRLRIGPDFAIGLGTNVKRPGLELSGRRTELLVKETTTEDMLPYERLLGDAMVCDPTLFARQDAVEAAWRVVDPVLGNRTKVYPYKPGTWGPKEAERVAPAGGWAPVLP